MSIPIGKKIRNIREALQMGRQEFVNKTGIPKNTLIQIEVNDREVKSNALIAIANCWPQYSAYLLTDHVYTAQKNPAYEIEARQPNTISERYRCLLESDPNYKSSHTKEDNPK